ncbi:anti-sigma factor family protein [Rhodococcus rhodnii]|uniref:RNA polymerase subunit sigma-70 n=1 Tax=Rhodococcus rhodnii LMG 5362 TaxID=1273125 RepID=R7WQ26_9NOCA|nr:hypothetical protein [Rhodococcus rhodnii]EOM76104.1 hypothetical protein Rrhod_2470 [Rhodococcus rhodnii LMG 5362]
MTLGPVPREFGSTEHLASEAIAAYVDGELRMTAYLRASRHLAMCAQCAAEVDSQQQARRALRGSGEMTMPPTLLGALSRIPSGDPSTRPDAPSASASGFGPPRRDGDGDGPHDPLSLGALRPDRTRRWGRRRRH